MEYVPLWERDAENRGIEIGIDKKTIETAKKMLEKGFDLDRKRIALSEQIKKLGEYKAMIRLHPEVTAEVTVLVNAEEQAGDEA